MSDASRSESGPQSDPAAWQEPDSPASESADAVLQTLGVSADHGLSSKDARGRRRRAGRNRLRKAQRRSALSILVDQFANVIGALLAAASVLAFVFGQTVEGFAVLGALLINGAIGFVTEWRAVRSMEALQRMGRRETTVRREGELQTVAATDLVPGDIVILDSGDIVTADLRVLESARLETNESALTGESMPVAKQEAPVDADAPLAEQASMLFKGTAVTEGSGAGVVVATGMQTELGRVSSLVEEAEEERAPIEKRLDHLGRHLIWVTLGICAVMAVVGGIAGKDLFLIVETAIALAVATVPEGLPIVATIALARGMHRMAKRNALVEQLSAVETLGSTNLILTDKTGTLTENRMQAVRLKAEAGDVTLNKGDDESYPEAVRDALRAGVLCNNASLSEKADDGNGQAAGVGDPMEVALLEAGRDAGFERDELLERMPEDHEEAFDPDTKMMATVHKADEGTWLYAVKGAPEAVLEQAAHVRIDGDTRPLAEDDRERWRQTNRDMAGQGLRVLAFAQKRADAADAAPYEDLEFLGFAGLMDPPRAAVREGLSECQQAGIRVVMITGDQAETALYVGRELGLIRDGEATVGPRFDDDEALSEDEKEEARNAVIFARATPEQKMSLLELHQQAGGVIAMLGDGVNDAPALKQADVGVVMGRRGTQVAREAADIVLQDDRFNTIVTAIRFGRIIFGNIRRFILYLLSGNVAEIMAVGAAATVSKWLPLLPLQILFLNMILDVFPALALGIGEGDENVMARPPRDPERPILAARDWWMISGYGLVIAVFTLTALYVGIAVWHLQPHEAITLSFLTLGLSRLWHVFNMRPPGSHLWRNQVTRNPWVWAAIALCVPLMLGAVYLPGAQFVLKTRPPGVHGWALVLACSFGTLVAGQIAKLVYARLRREESP